VAHSDPPDEPNRDDPPGGGHFDALRLLEDRLDRASEAAERLIAEAAQSAARAASAPRPPPAGWRSSEPDAAGDGGRGSELEWLASALQSLRDLIPAELQRRLAEALRELLLAVRALLDWYLERLEQRRTEPLDVQDIPIL
jgi:hypothetical protein